MTAGAKNIKEVQAYLKKQREKNGDTTEEYPKLTGNTGVAVQVSCRRIDDEPNNTGLLIPPGRFECTYTDEDGNILMVDIPGKKQRGEMEKKEKEDNEKIRKIAYEHMKKQWDEVDEKEGRIPEKKDDTQVEMSKLIQGHTRMDWAEASRRTDDIPTSNGQNQTSTNGTQEAPRMIQEEDGEGEVICVIPVTAHKTGDIQELTKGIEDISLTKSTGEITMTNTRAYSETTTTNSEHEIQRSPRVLYWDSEWKGLMELRKKTATRYEDISWIGKGKVHTMETIMKDQTGAYDEIQTYLIAMRHRKIAEDMITEWEDRMQRSIYDWGMAGKLGTKNLDVIQSNEEHKYAITLMKNYERNTIESIYFGNRVRGWMDREGLIAIGTGPKGRDDTDDRSIYQRVDAGAVRTCHTDLWSEVHQWGEDFAVRSAKHATQSYSHRGELQVHSAIHLFDGEDTTGDSRIIAG